ncbi:hypothetical protein K1719_037065 [Acacia pycnantha]|nr:hypothetical protein K1719_037065 [Acacia pycnantha]
MISAVSWVPKGALKSQPVMADPPSKEEMEELINSVNMERSGDSENEDNDQDMDVGPNEQDDEVAQALSVADALGKTSEEKFDDITVSLRELDMDNYDEDDEGVELFSSGIGDLYYPSNELDPYIVDQNDDDSEDLEDMTINPTDSVIVCACNEGDINRLEVYIVEDSNSGEINMYVRNYIIISAFPLCTAWSDFHLKGEERGSFIAVGTMDPSIEIFDLDVVDGIEPCTILGGMKKRKGNKKPIKYRDGSHTSSVLSLAWNAEYKNVLASASADKQVKIWDVDAGKCEITMEHHSDKVQAIAWNHYAPRVLLSGSFDHTVVMKDGRIPTHSGFKWSVSADVESLAWDPHAEHSFVVSLEDGTIKGFDVRAAQSSSTSEPPSVFTLHAHDKAATSICYNPSAANLLATASMDKSVKLWDLSNQPSCVASHNPKVGAIFSISFSKDDPFLLAIGGSKDKLQVWDTSSAAGVSQRFGAFTKNKPQTGS